MDSCSECWVAFADDNLRWSPLFDPFGQWTLASGGLVGLGHNQWTLRMHVLLKVIDLVLVLSVLHLQGPAQQDLPLEVEIEDLSSTACTASGGESLA